MCECIFCLFLSVNKIKGHLSTFFSDVSLQGRIKSLQKELASIKRVLNNVTEVRYLILLNITVKKHKSTCIFSCQHIHVHE